VRPLRRRARVLLPRGGLQPRGAATAFTTAWSPQTLAASPSRATALLLAPPPPLRKQSWKPPPRAMSAEDERWTLGGRGGGRGRSSGPSPAAMSPPLGICRSPLTAIQIFSNGPLIWIAISNRDPFIFIYIPDSDRDL
jgi:hypothetical protein